jgi:hypothetical protein
MVVSPLGQLDQVEWQGTKHGLFSMKSAYYLEMQFNRQTKGESSRTGQEDGLWKAIWSLNVPPTWKHFVWKMCNNILPTKVSLFAKNIVQSPLCPCCQREEETIAHILWTCPSSLAVWQECPRCIQKLAMDPTDGRSLFEGWLQKLEGADFIFAIAVVRQLWLRRNAFVFEEYSSLPCRFYMW